MSQNFESASQTVAQAIDRNDVPGAASLLSQIYQTDSRAFGAIVASEQTREQQNPGITRLAIQDRGNGTSSVFVTDDDKQTALAGIVPSRLDLYQTAQPVAGIVAPRLDTLPPPQPLTNIVAPRLDALPPPQPFTNIVAPTLDALPPPPALGNSALAYPQTNYAPGYPQAAIYNPQQQLNFEAQRLSRMVNYNNFGGTVALLQNDFRTNPGVAVRLVQNEMNRERMQPAFRMPGHTHVEMRGGTALVSDSYHQPVVVGRVGNMNPYNMYGNNMYGNPALAYAPMPLVVPMRPFMPYHRRV